LRERAIAIWKRIVPGDGQLEVLGSGITATDYISAEDLPGDDAPILPEEAAEPIHARIGRFPELLAPGTAEELIEAYERWIERYLDLAGGALAVWIDRWAPIEGTDDDSKPLIEWTIEIRWRRTLDQKLLTCTIDGRKDLELFQRARGAWQTSTAAWAQVDTQAKLAAEEVVGSEVRLERKPPTADALVTEYEELCERYANVLRAHFWGR
jgi:hypothetical protein